MSGPPWKVIIADDDEAIRMLFRTVIGFERDFELVGDANDCASLQRLIADCEGAGEGGHPDIVLLDISMPQLDAGEVVQRLRHSFPHIRVLVFSGYAAEHVEEALGQIRPDGFVEKGGGPAGVIERMRDVLVANGVQEQGGWQPEPR